MDHAHEVEGAVHGPACGIDREILAIWRALRQVVTAIDSREVISGRLERRDGTVVDCTTVPLPDAATLVTLRRGDLEMERGAKNRDAGITGTYVERPAGSAEKEPVAEGSRSRRACRRLSSHAQHSEASQYVNKRTRRPDGVSHRNE